MPRRQVPDALALLVGQRIRQLRKEAGLTIERLAWESEVKSKGHLSSIERGLVSVSLHTLAAICDRLGVEPLDLLTFPMEEPRHAVIDRTRHLTAKDLAEIGRQVDAMIKRGM